MEAGQQPPMMTGYDTHDRYWASRYTQGGRLVYSLDLPLATIAATLPRPNPSQPTPGNRRINEPHARGFAKYVLGTPEWVAPALLLRAPEQFPFEAQVDVVDGSQFGVLSVPRRARELRILDGQHRILGIHIAAEEVDQKAEECREHLALARRAGSDTDIQLWTTRVQEYRDLKERLANEKLSIQIHVEDSSTRYTQMFVDIADNALGISDAIRSRFDSRHAVNRALQHVTEHALLKGRVDEQQDRITATSPYLLGAKHVADIIRALEVGINGRVTKRREDEISDAALIEQTNNFLDTLTSAFPQLTQVMDNVLSVSDLRKTNLLGSTTMLRALAGAYHDLRQEDVTDDEISDLFERLSPHMAAPVTSSSPWMQTGVFDDGALAPRARSQDLRVLSSTIASWHSVPPPWLV